MRVKDSTPPKPDLSAISAHRVIDAMPVIGREARDLRQLVEVELVVEMIEHIGGDALHARAIFDPAVAACFCHARS